MVHCAAIQRGAIIMCSLATSTSSFLFLRRVHAVFNGHSQLVVRVFSFFWVILVGLTFALPLLGISIQASTNNCVTPLVKRYIMANSVVLFLYDSAVFLAISYRISWGQSMDRDKSTYWTLSELSWVSKAILHGGQRYYL